MRTVLLSGRQTVVYASAILVLVILLFETSCTPEINIAPTRTELYAVHGYVDAQQGVSLEVIETLAANATVTPEVLERSRISDAEVTILFGNGVAPITVSNTTPGIYEYLGPLPATGPVELRVRIGEVVMRCVDSIPPATGFVYDSLETRSSDVDVVGNVVDSLYVIHEARYRNPDPSLSTYISSVRWRSDGSLTVRSPASTTAGCIAKSTFPAGSLALTGSCYVDRDLRLVVGSGAREGEAIEFAISQSYNQDFPIYFEALEQFSSSDVLGGIYEIVPAPSNVLGGGGFVYISNSRLIRVSTP